MSNRETEVLDFEAGSVASQTTRPRASTIRLLKRFLYLAGDMLALVIAM